VLLPQGVVASENQRAQEAALALYRREYKESLVEEGAMWAEHQVRAGACRPPLRLSFTYTKPPCCPSSAAPPLLLPLQAASCSPLSWLAGGGAQQPRPRPWPSPSRLPLLPLQRALDAALAAFGSAALGDAAAQEQCAAAVRAAAEARFSEVRRDSAARAQQAISERLLAAQQRFGTVGGTGSSPPPPAALPCCLPCCGLAS
jgi:hypothetical protein